MTMMDIIDTRDLIAELEELDAIEGAMDGEDIARRVAIAELLDEIGDEAGYGVALIPESDFVSYAQDLAEDIGALPAEYTWPTSSIDWDKAAWELKMDYSSVEFDGATYLFRA